MGRFVFGIVAAIALGLSALPLSSAQQPRAGVVDNLEGTVTVWRAASRQPVGMKVRDDLFVNDRIVTGDNSFVSLQLGESVVVVMRERSTLRLTEVPSEARLDLDSGKVLIAVTNSGMRPGRRLAVRTSNA